MRPLSQPLATLIMLAFVSTVACAKPRSHAPTDYPNRPIRFIVPFAPGGGADTVARIVAPKLAEVLGQQLVIDNRAGAGGNVAAETVARAAPDGYTLLQSTVGHAISMSLYENLPYDLGRDFSAVTGLASIPFLLAVHPSVTANSVRELVMLAKSRPQPLNYASSGGGSASHLAMERFKSAAQFGAQHIPYKGSGPSTADLVAGQVQLMFTTISTAQGFIKAGRLRALGVASLKRLASAPEIPTIDESGVKGFEASTWIGMHVPAKTSQAIISALHAHLARILRQPETVERLTSQGWDVIGNTPQEFNAYVRAEIIKWADAVKQSGARAE